MDLPVESYLIHAIADGAKVECRNKNRNTQTGDRWTEVTNFEVVFTRKDLQFRVKPLCDYVAYRIEAVESWEAVELYKYWIEGGELLDDGKVFRLTDTPFETFIDHLIDVPNAMSWLRKKVDTITQTLWIDVNSSPIRTRWVNEGEEIEESCLESSRECWYEVHGCTEEVEKKL
jgi:hypothetical protein